MFEGPTARVPLSEDVQLLGQFEEFITNERGLARQTVVTYLSRVGVFLDCIGGE